jgi:hypothetical protein
MDFKERVLADNGIFESLDCLVNLYNELNGDYLEIVYKGRIFCTNQEIDSFNLLDKEFKQYKKTNEFVIYE